MSTSTSMSYLKLKGAGESSTKPMRSVQDPLPGRKLSLDSLREGLGHGVGHEIAHVAPEGGHLLDPGRGKEAVVRRGEYVHRLDLRSELAVELVHLELVLEVGDRAQA